MKSVLIAGAGLVGPLLSIFLRRRGYDVYLHERRPDPNAHALTSGLEGTAANSRRSINLVITSRGIHALNLLDFWQEAKKLTVSVRGRMIHAPNGELSYQPYGRNDNECNYSISRSGLNQFLLEHARACGVHIEFNSQLQSVDLKNRVAVFTSDDLTSEDVAPARAAASKAKQIHYDIFFAADGAGSVARQALEKTGAVQVQTEWIDTDYKELVIPKELGQKIERNALHIWPRRTHMMMALPNLEGDQTVTLYLPRADHPFSFENTGTEKDVEKLFNSEFSDAIALMPDYKSDFFSNPQGRLGTVRASSWIFNDSFCLIGDAAHAIVPFFGQGMNLGFEDCTTLMRILETSGDNSIDNGGDNWAEALQIFDSTQRPNANAIADMALDNFIEMRDRVGQPTFQLKKKIEARLERELPQSYRSRYGMIAYTLIPYRLAQKAGEIQSSILDELASKATSNGEFDLSLARQLIEEKLTPFYHANNLIERFG